MRAMRMLAIGCGMILLAACRVPIPETTNESVIEEKGTFNSVKPIDPTRPAPTSTATDAATADGRLPAAFLGRWGLVAADCTSTRGDNKGLMTVTPDRLTFYESRAAVTKLKVVSPTEAQATLSFSGEGQEWTQDTPLVLEDNGNALTRTADGQLLRYTRCGA